jgi:hypothetical protein
MLKKLSTKSLLSAVLAASILVGCNKDDDPKTKLCFLTTVVEVGSAETTTINYTLENQKITKVNTKSVYSGGSFEDNTTITYDSKGNITETNSSDGTRTVFTYTNNQVTKVEDFDGTTLSDRTDYEYSNGQIVKAQYYDETNPGTFVKDDYDVFEYANTTSKNPIKIKSFSKTGTTPSYTVEYQYDDKKNPYSASAAILNLLSLYAEASENNITKATFTSASSPNVQTNTYTYEYNTEGYPTKSTRVATNTGQPSTSTSTTTYTYNCN